MRAARWSISLVAVVGLLAATIAAAVIWLLLSDPVRGADAISRASTGQVAPLMQALGSVIVDALKGIFKYL